MFVRSGKAEGLIRTLKDSPATQMAEWSGKENLNITLHWELAVAAFENAYSCECGGGNL